MTTPNTDPDALELPEIEKVLWEADPDWRKKLRPNLSGREAALFVLFDIAHERRILASEVIEHRALAAEKRRARGGVM